jgi:hypothetical protein
MPWPNVNEISFLIMIVPYKRDWGQPACPKVWKKYEDENR